MVLMNLLAGTQTQSIDLWTQLGKEREMIGEGGFHTYTRPRVE